MFISVLNALDSIDFPVYCIHLLKNAAIKKIFSNSCRAMPIAVIEFLTTTGNSFLKILSLILRAKDFYQVAASY